MTSLHEIKVVHFEAGSMALHANTTSGYSHSNSTGNDISTTTSCSSRRILVGREIEGKLVLNLSMQSFVRGLWVKLVGCSMSTSEDLAGNVTIQSDDLFRGSSSCGADDVHYHLDGLHEVLLGYGEEVTTTTTSTGESHVILQPGQHQWSFSFTLPNSAPASFFSDSSSVTYRLVAVLDAYSEYERVTIGHDIIVLHYSHLRCLQLWDEVSSRSEVIRKNSALSTAPGGTTTSNDRRMPTLLPSLLQLIRFASPQPKAVRLGMIVSKTCLGASTFNPYRSSTTTASSSSGSSSSSSTSSLEFLCSIDNLSLADGAYVVVRGEVYSEYTSRESPQHPFTAHYPGKNESIDDSSSSSRSSREGRCTCILSKISETRKAVYNSSELARFIFSVPLDIDLKPSIRGLCSEPDPVSINISQALHHGQIIHYRTECSSFRYRIMLRVTLLCLNNNGEGSSNQQLVAPLFGEIYIPPPNDTVQSCIHMLDAPPPRSNPRESSIDAWNDADEDDDENAVVVRAPSLIASRPLRPAAVSNRPPSGGRNRAPRNVGGLGVRAVSTGIRATCGSSLSGNTATARSTSRSGDENTFIHPNIYIPTPPPLSSTPHAKPTSARPVIRVDAEMVSRGPAAPLIDRLADHPSVPSTPHRFAFMYEVVSAEVMEGTPVPSAATPVPLSTEEFHRVRRRTWHYPTRDACVNAVPTVDVVSAVDVSAYGLSDQGQDIVSHRTYHNSIDGGQLHMNSRLFDGTYDRITESAERGDSSMIV